MATGIVIPADVDAPVQVQRFFGIGDLQDAVQGWIEPMEIPQFGSTVYVNEAAGRRRRVPLNSRATLLWWFFTPASRYKDMVAGDVIVAGPFDDGHSDGSVPKPVLAQLTDGGLYGIQVRPLGGSTWFETRSSYRGFFDALSWGMLLGERWASTDEVRVVRLIDEVDDDV